MNKINGWVVGEVVVRKGTIEGWWEMVVKKEDGSIVKMIGKKIGRFNSEKNGEKIDLGEWGKVDGGSEF